MIRTMPDSGILSVILKYSWSAGPPKDLFSSRDLFPCEEHQEYIERAEAVKLRILLQHLDKSS